MHIDDFIENEERFKVGYYPLVYWNSLAIGWAVVTKAQDVCILRGRASHIYKRKTR